ncbi:MAG: Relaxase/mobilization nuclease domain [Rhodobacteraceae bacterium HLUCCA12]|nr:MAG: Relaxase/mobilization nuclease domain [Rhodobacteraceae bacterium HLUCCA12]
MILKGNQRAGGSQLAVHLTNLRDNDHVTVHELRGFVSDDLHGAFNEAYAVSRGTRCKQFLFSLSLNPPETADVPVEAFEQAIASIEKRLGLAGQPRAIVFHEKNGRRHAHCVWSRIDAAEMKAINLPHYKMKLRDVSRDLYLEHGWQLPRGLIDPGERDPLNFSQGEWQQALRIEADPKKLKQTFIDCWAASDCQNSLESALADHGLYLARGERRGYVAVDGRGEIYSLSRWTGKKSKELKGRLGPPEQLRSIEETKKLIAQRLDVAATEIQTAAQKRKEKELSSYKVRRDELVAEQRVQRSQLAEKQRGRATLERNARQARMPKGLRALWARITGTYRALQREIEREAAACDQRDRLELAELIKSQLANRRELKGRLHENYQRYDGELETLFAEIKAHQSRLLAAQNDDGAPPATRRRAPRRSRDS